MFYCDISSGDVPYFGIPIRTNFPTFSNEMWMFSYTIYYNSGNNCNASIVLFNPINKHLYSINGTDYGTEVYESNCSGLKVNKYIGTSSYTEYFDIQEVRSTEIDGVPYIGYTVGNTTGLNAGNMSFAVSYYDFINATWKTLPYFAWTLMKNDMCAISNVSNGNIIVTISRHFSSDYEQLSDAEIWRYTNETGNWTCDGVIITNQEPHSFYGFIFLGTTIFSEHTNGNRFIQIHEQLPTWSTGLIYRFYIYDSINHKFLINGTDISDIINNTLGTF